MEALASPVQHDALAVDHPEVAEVLDLQSGVHLAHDELIGTDYEQAIQLRLELRTGIKREECRYACALCGVPVYLVSIRRHRRFFFRHTIEDGRCSARTRGELSQSEIDARKYNGVKESDRHLRMKEWLAESLGADPRFSDVAVEKRWPGKLTAEWRKPDVRGTYQGVPVVFEIQLSTTYINVIAERRDFYMREGGLLCWVFATFDAGARRLTQDDVFYNNNRNAFVVSKATRDASLADGRFQLECIWAMPSIDGATSLHRKVVPFVELTLEQEKQRVFYFDFDGIRAATLAKAREQKALRLAGLRERFEAWWIAYADGQAPNLAVWEELRSSFALEGIALPPHGYSVPRVLLNALYSAKHGRVVGWRFKAFIEVAHRIEPGHRGYLHFFRRALAAFGRAAQIRAEDKSGKWAAKVEHYKERIARLDPAYGPDRTHSELVELLFPEMSAP